MSYVSVLWAVAISLLFNMVNCLPTIDAPGVIIGTCQPISSQCNNNQASFTATLIPPSITTIKSMAMSLIGYDTFVSSVVYISPQITQANSTHIRMSATCMNNLLFTKLQFSYILLDNTVQYLDVYKICFLCPPQVSLDGERIYTLGLQNHVRPYQDVMRVMSSIAGMNVSNVQEDGISFQVRTDMTVNSPVIHHKIYAHTHTVVSSICITTIIYDYLRTNTQDYRILVSVEEKYIDAVNEARTIQPDQSFYFQLNSMYYGIASMEIYFQSATRQTVLFDINNFANFFSNFQGNSNINKIQMNAFFIRKTDCPVTDFLDPLSFACVSTCPAQTGPNPTTKYCEPCHPTCVICQGSGVNKCKSCNNASVNKFRQLRGGLAVSHCDCQAQYFQDSDGSPVCKKCSQVIDNCLQCPDANFCSLCMTGYSYNPVTNKCGCADLAKFLSRSYCLDYPGCINVLTSINIPVYCGTCNRALNFELNQDYTCKCQEGFKFDPPSISCIEDCGDGILIKEQQCDDGNSIDDDGCSALCKIEPGYMCMTSIEPSKCMEYIEFELKYQYCKRDITSNSATFAFILTPPTSTLSEVDLTKSFTFTFASIIQSYIYNDQTGELLITIKFTQTLQGEQHKLTMSFDSVGIWTDPLTTSFQVRGMNSWLIMDQYASSYKIVIYGIAMVCGMAWILGLIAALIGFKNLTIELILPIQALYFTVVSLGSNAPGLRALHFMNLINGYNSLQGFKMKEVVSEDDSGYSHLEYMSNMNYFILVDAGCVVLLFIVKGFHFLVTRKFNSVNQMIANMLKQKQEMKKDKQAQEGKSGKKNAKQQAQAKRVSEAYHTASLKSCQQSLQTLRKYKNVTGSLLLFLGERLSSTILLLTLQSSIFYLGTFIIYTSEYRLFSAFVNNISCLVAVILAFIGLAVYHEEQAKQVYIVFQNQLRYSYTKLFTIWYVIFLVALVIVCAFRVTGLMLVAVLLLCFLIGVLIVKNPYKTKNAHCLRFILPVVQHCILTVPCLMLWVVGFLNTLNPLFYFITTIMIIGCCILGLIFTAIRMYFEIKNFKLTQKQQRNLDKDDDQPEKDITNELYLENQKQKEKEGILKPQQKQQKVGVSKVEQKPQQISQFGTKLRQNLLNKTNPTNTSNNQDYQTKKKQQKKKQQKQRNADEQDYSSKSSENSENLEDIKKKLRKDLIQRRNLRKR